MFTTLGWIEITQCKPKVDYKLKGQRWISFSFFFLSLPLCSGPKVLNYRQGFFSPWRLIMVLTNWHLTFELVHWFTVIATCFLSLFLYNFITLHVFKFPIFEQYWSSILSWHWSALYMLDLVPKKNYNYDHQIHCLRPCVSYPLYGVFLCRQPTSIKLVCLDLLALTFHWDLLKHLDSQNKPAPLACCSCLYTEQWGLTSI